MRRDDPMIQLARQLEPEFRRLREIEDELDELERQAYAQITEATVAVEGHVDLSRRHVHACVWRLDTVKGYVEDGRHHSALDHDRRCLRTSKQHMGRQADWTLPASWHQASRTSST